MGGASWSLGIIEGGILLDGVDDFIKLVDGAEGDPFHDDFDEYTIMTWFYLNNIDDRQVVYDQGGTDNGINLYIYDELLYGGVWSEDHGYDGDWISTPISKGWHHSALVYSTNEGYFKLYLDGILKNNVDDGGTIHWHNAGSAIGSLYRSSKFENGDLLDTGSDYHFDGIIDEFRIYSRALGISEIQVYYQQGLSSEDIVGCWNFDEGSGTIASDSSGYRNDGAISGATWVDGISGNALYFDGSYDKVYIEDSASLDAASGLTLEAWVNASSFFGEGSHNGNPIIAKWKSNTIGQYRISAHSGGSLKFVIADGSESDFLTVENALTVNHWYHVVSTWDGGYMKIYVNGELAGEKATTITELYGQEYSEDYVQIGHDTGGNYPYWYFDGVIDEVSIYNYALTAGEIEEHYGEFWGKEENPELESSPTIENLFYFDISDPFQSISGILQHTLYGTYIWVRITCSITNPEMVDQVKCKFILSGGVPSEIIDKMEEIEPGKFMLEKKFVNTPDLVLRLFHYCITTPGTSSPPPTYAPEVYLDEIIIKDTEGVDYNYSEYMPIRVPTFCGLICGYDTLVVSAFSPVDLLVTSPSGKKVGAFYEEGNYSYEISEISSALYTGHNIEPEMIIIIGPEEGEYITDVYGAGDGKYNLSMIYLCNDNISEQKEYSDITVSAGEVFNYSIPINIEDLEGINGTPGFEFIFIIIALVSIFFWNKYKTKYDKNL